MDVSAEAGRLCALCIAGKLPLAAALGIVLDRR
jgi:hypothetical protein